MNNGKCSITYLCEFSCRIYFRCWLHCSTIISNKWRIKKKITTTKWFRSETTMTERGAYNNRRMYETIIVTNGIFLISKHASTVYDCILICFVLVSKLPTQNVSKLSRWRTIVNGTSGCIPGIYYAAKMSIFRFWPGPPRKINSSRTNHLYGNSSNIQKNWAMRTNFVCLRSVNYVFYQQVTAVSLQIGQTISLSTVSILRGRSIHITRENNNENIKIRREPK